MQKVLRDYFPTIRERWEVLEEIRSKKELSDLFYSWEEEDQEKYLDICTGVRGVKVLYDTYFKAVMNPDATPERLEELLSLILQTNVKILKVLPNEAGRVAAEKSLLIMDIVVQLEDGSIANVEVQKLGYAFPGQRSACYSADLLLRQYKRIKSEKKKKFKYKDIKKVYTIIFFEESPGEFHRFPDNYIHHGKQQFDTGLQIELLQEYILIPLDIFKESQHNKNVSENSRLEAWLTFFTVDSPEEILDLIEKYPDFEKLYREVYSLCRNMEYFMGLFSEELAELDKNTVEYMIDEMQAEIDRKKKQLEEMNEQFDKQNEMLDEQSEKLNEQSEKLNEQSEKLNEQSEKLNEQSEKLNEQSEKLNEQSDKITEQSRIIEKLQKELAQLKGSAE